MTRFTNTAAYVLLCLNGIIVCDYGDERLALIWPEAIIASVTLLVYLFSEGSLEIFMHQKDLRHVPSRTRRSWIDSE